MPTPLYRFLGLALLFLASIPAIPAEDLHLSTRRRQPSAADSNRWEAAEQMVTWDARKTAIVICDMWDRHWCAGATRRVAAMAPRMNEVVKEARRAGVFIIHCPSDTMKFYEGTPGRRLAQAAPVVPPKVPLQGWCSLDRTREAPLPIDDADGGCDDWPPCKGYSAWKQQIPSIEIRDGDAVTDSAEAYYLMQQRGIDNVIVMGVHLNMCVLGRPFSIRQMVGQGKNVVLMRDLTDTMYNSRQRPYVPHTAGTALMIEHVEKYWCPTISSVAFLGGAEFRFAEDRRPQVVLMIGEDEYHTWETLPAFGRQELEWRGLRVSVIQEDAKDKNHFPGLVEALRDADALVVSVRRRGPPAAQLDAVRAHLQAGRPLIGIRTACHAFAPRDGESGESGTETNAWWPTFDPDVLGGHYTGHHGAGPPSTVRVAPGADGDALLTGVDPMKLVGHGSLYKVSPLRDTVHPLLIGSVSNQPPEPVAWTHTYGAKKARIFYTSLGHPDDFADPTFRRLLLNAVLQAVGMPLPPASATAATATASDPKAFATAWQKLAVPGTWEDLAHLDYDGIAWYRCAVRIPAGWQTRDVTLAVEAVDNAHEAFVNGARIGGAGHFPPQYQNGLDQANRYVVPREKLLADAWNTIAIRVYDHEGRGGFKGPAPQLGTEQQHIRLQGTWQFRTGDDPGWAGELADPEQSGATFAKVEDGPVPHGSAGHKMAPRGTPLSPAEAARSFTVPDDLEFEQVLAEPVVRQPVFLNFDERGRLWVVQYIQYPAPAGLNVVSKDVFWRAVYDRVPEPPPRGPRGLDKITIHEDTDGDGKFDKHTTFVEGLNIATAVARGRGGVWVLNPPYLLFYPDRNNDDVPDGPPEVHLQGFGLEDTHSVINSLRWGPDGWLYAAQGSTVSAQVRHPSGAAGLTNEPAVSSQGQNIWRYHPETHRYEIFAEGGGNAFGVDLDDKGRIYSGHNGGDTRGFHYLQGAYLRKGFEKHGELSNPYAFGYFPNMTGTRGERFTHNFVINHGAGLPARYEGKLFGVEPLQGRIVLSDVMAEGSTFRTVDLERVVTSSDSWFRPVDIKVGPDGAIYVCDWYDRQVTHTRNQEGNIDTSNGRIYRLKAKGAKPLAPLDLARLSNDQLLGMLAHSNIWFRQTALRLLADRHDQSLAPRLAQQLARSTGQIALETLWAWHLSGGFDQAAARSLLDHADPFVRLWTVRLLGDDRQVEPATARKLAELAAREPNIEVRAQLACTAQRLPAADSLAILHRLLVRDEDANDARQPLLCWWALEKQCTADAEAVLRLFEDSTLWRRPLVQRHLLDRLMRRFAAAGTRRDLHICARLLQLAPLREQSEQLMKGFEEAFKGRSLAGLPDELIAAMSRHGVGSSAFRLRQGTPEALQQALRTIGDPQANKQERLQFTQILGEVHPPSAVPPLLQVLEKSSDAELRKTALTALQAFDDPAIGRRVVGLYRSLTGEVRLAAQTTLASRAGWTLDLAQAVDQGTVPPSEIPRDTVRQMKLHKDPQVAALLNRLWPATDPAPAAVTQTQIQHLGAVIRAGRGDPYAGQKLFNTTCGACHTLFNRGGQVGPDLTSYQRSDLDGLLLNIVNPSAQIREGYESFVIETKDDRTLNGFLVERDNQLVVLRGVDGQNIALDRKDIVEMHAGALSLMPEGLLDPLTEQQVRDLFAYLRSTQPLAN